MKAMIFAAGLGSRLRPLTDTLPKALVPVGGKPLLQILLDRLTEAGFDEIVINVHHFADQITDYLQSHPQIPHITISDESEQLLETGGGIRHAMRFFNDAKPFLIHNVDILHHLDLRSFYDQWASQGDAVLLVSNRSTQRYLLFDNENRLVGWTNIKTGEVKSPYHNLIPQQYRMYAFSGIHILNPSLLPLMYTWPKRFSIIDFYLAICKHCVIKACVCEKLELIDVGKSDTLAQADQFIKQCNSNINLTW